MPIPQELIPLIKIEGVQESLIDLMYKDTYQDFQQAWKKARMLNAHDDEIMILCRTRADFSHDGATDEQRT